MRAVAIAGALLIPCVSGAAILTDVKISRRLAASAGNGDIGQFDESSSRRFGTFSPAALDFSVANEYGAASAACSHESVANLDAGVFTIDIASDCSASLFPTSLAAGASYYSAALVDFEVEGADGETLELRYDITGGHAIDWNVDYLADRKSQPTSSGVYVC